MAYSGITAKIEYAAVSANGAAGEAKKIAYVSNWSVEESCDIVEFTTLGSDCKEKMPAQYGWSASADGTADFSAEGGHAALRDCMISRSPVRMTFYLDGATYLSGDGYIESLSTDISAEDKGNISISVSGCGKLALHTDGAADPSSI